MTAIQITPLEPRTYIRVKSWASTVSAVVPTKVGIHIGTAALPATVGTTVPGLASILCVGPAEWLLTSAARSVRDLVTHIALGDLPDGLILVDLSDGLSGLEIKGLGARELLAKGCGLDFHPTAFKAGHCTRTRFAQISVLIHCTDPARFELYVARSYFEYLHSWLLDAAIEFTPAQAGGTAETA